MWKVIKQIVKAPGLRAMYCTIIAILYFVWMSYGDTSLSFSLSNRPINFSISVVPVVIMIAGLVAFPVGLDSQFVRHYCRDARAYHGGSCQIGWAFLLAIVGTSLSVFTPFLSQYTDLVLQEASTEVSADNKEKQPAFV